MKVIDLLNKIANGETPKKIFYNDRQWVYDEKLEDYITNDDSRIDWRYTVWEYLNDEVEVIEEEKKIPEKIDLAWQNSFDEQVQQDCIKMIIKNINEIIDKINEGK